MSNLDILFDKLRSQPKPPEEQWKAKRQEWIEDLEKLWATISEWLEKGADEGLFTLERRTVELDEEDLGTYEAPALDIQLNAGAPRVIKMEPTAMRVVGVIPTPGVRILGAVGRVDLRCGPARAMLLRRAPGKWQFVGVDRGFSSGDYVVDLTQDSLGEVIDELLG
jgi:hypothetical protein